jgi:hypothetical protein
MKTLIVKLTHESEAKFLMTLLKSIRFVESVSLVASESESTLVNEPETNYNWQQPQRAATEDEIEKLIADMEKDQGTYSGEEILSFVKKELKAWEKKGK